MGGDSAKSESATNQNKKPKPSNRTHPIGKRERGKCFLLRLKTRSTKTTFIKQEETDLPGQAGPNHWGGVAVKKG